MFEYKDSGIDWLKKIPNHWQICRIKDVFALRSEKNYLPLADVQLLSLYTDIGIFKHGEFQGRGNKATNADGYKEVYPGDIVVNIILAWMGAIGRSEYRGITSPAYDVYAPVGEIDSKFYHYLFRTPGFTGECYKCGRGIMAMRWRTYSSEFTRIKIPVPPLDEQEKIVRYLDKKTSDMTKFIDAKKKQVELLAELKRSIISDAVTNGLFGDKTPDTWKLKKIREIFKERRIKVSSRDYPALSVSKFGVTPQLETAVKTDNDDNRKLVKVGDFVINSRSDRKGSSGISNYEGSVSLIYIVLKFVADMNGKFFHYLLRSVQFTEEFYRNGRGLVSDLWTTSFDKIKNTYLPVPPLWEQKEIADYLDVECAKIENLIEAIQKEISLVEELRKSLISEVVTGKIDVRELI